MEMQAIGSRSLDESFLGKQIEYLAEFDMDEAGTASQTPIWIALNFIVRFNTF